VQRESSRLLQAYPLEELRRRKSLGQQAMGREVTDLGLQADVWEMECLWSRPLFVCEAHPT